MTSEAVPTTANPSDAPRKKSPFIVGPFYDSLFFIFSPLLAMALGFWVSIAPQADAPVSLGGAYRSSVSNMLIGSFIMAHLVIVFFRSHGNKNIFQRHPVRFTLAPIALVVAMISSQWIFVSVLVIATWWDVYHSSLQTFGFGRLYDMKAGNHPKLGRRLDQMLNVLLYAGPIFAGATLMDHMNDFSEFNAVGSQFFTSIPAHAEANKNFFTWFILLIGIPFLIYYFFAYWMFHKQGYKVSWPKIALLVSTAFCSIITWGFNSFGEAFFIMNFFHALQYFALVWWSEKKNMVETFSFGRLKVGKPVALVLFLVVAFAYGFWAETSVAESVFALAVVNTVAIMHFWYDGFIWSVRKKHV